MKRLSAVMLVASLIAPAAASADFIESFSTPTDAQVGGQPVAASALFEAVGGTLTITLSDLAVTPTKGQVLTGLFFSIPDANPTLGPAPALGQLTSQPPTFVPTGATLFTSKTGSMAGLIDITGTWALKQAPGGTLGSVGGNTFPWEYGLSATADGGLFPAGAFTTPFGLPTSSNQDDYGLVGPSTFPNGSASSSFKQTFPYAENQLIFVLSNFAGSGIADVAFAYTSAGSDIVRDPPPPAVPGPSTLLLVLSAAASILVGRRIRARSLAPTGSIVRDE